MASVQRAREINGITTNLIVHSFADRIVVLVTQLGKVGCLIQASIPSSVPLLPPPPPPALPAPPTAISLTPLVGHPPDSRSLTLFNLYAAQASSHRLLCENVLTNHGSKQVAAIVWTKAGQLHRRPVIVGIALKKSKVDTSASEDDFELQEEDKQTFKEVMAMLMDCLD